MVAKERGQARLPDLELNAIELASAAERLSIVKQYDKMNNLKVRKTGSPPAVTLENF